VNNAIGDTENMSRARRITVNQSNMAEIIQRKLSTYVYFHRIHDAIYVKDGFVGPDELKELVENYEVYFSDGILWVVAKKRRKL